MSIEALTWAFRQPVKPSGTKFVLVALANMANEKGEAYPSMLYLSKVTQQDIKTITTAIDRLEAAGFVEDSGKRKGGTGQVKVYRIKTTAIGGVKDPQKREPLPESPPFLDSKTPVFPGKTPGNGGRIPHDPTGKHHEENPAGKKPKTKKEIYSEILQKYGAFDERTAAAKIEMRDEELPRLRNRFPDE